MSDLYLIGGGFILTLAFILYFALDTKSPRAMSKRHGGKSREWDSVTGKFPID